MKRLEQRWQRRWEHRAEGEVRTFRLVETAKIRCSIDEVWELVSPPEHAPLPLPDQVSRGYVVPGSPLVSARSSASWTSRSNAVVYEVLEHEPGRRDGRAALVA